MMPEELRQTVLNNVADLTQVRPQGPSDTILRLPFYDTMGDPVELSVHFADNGSVTIDDAGAIAGLLFSLDQHHEDSPAFKLVQGLAHAHELTLDFNEGLVSLNVAPKNTCKGIAEMAKILITIQTAAPLLTTHTQPGQEHRTISH